MKDKGITGLKPLNGQSDEQILADVKAADGRVQEQMAQQQVVHDKQRAEQRKVKEEANRKKIEANMGDLIAKHKAGVLGNQKWEDVKDK
jgi:hypothetical protein